jgi:hypothetical protein
MEVEATRQLNLGMPMDELGQFRFPGDNTPVGCARLGQRLFVRCPCVAGACCIIAAIATLIARCSPAISYVFCERRKSTNKCSINGTGNSHVFRYPVLRAGFPCVLSELALRRQGRPKCPADRRRNSNVFWRLNVVRARVTQFATVGAACNFVPVPRRTSDSNRMTMLDVPTTLLARTSGHAEAHVDVPESR